MSRTAKADAVTEKVADEKTDTKVTHAVDELALLVWCPRCDALPESECMNPSGGPISRPHYQRRRPILRAYQAGQMNRDDVVIRFPGRNGRKALV